MKAPRYGSVLAKLVLEENGRLSLLGADIIHLVVPRVGAGRWNVFLGARDYAAVRQIIGECTQEERVTDRLPDDVAAYREEQVKKQEHCRREFFALDTKRALEETDHGCVPSRTGGLGSGSE